MNGLMSTEKLTVVDGTHTRQASGGAHDDNAAAFRLLTEVM